MVSEYQLRVLWGFVVGHRSVLAAVFEGRIEASTIGGDDPLAVGKSCLASSYTAETLSPCHQPAICQRPLADILNAPARKK